MFLSLKWEYIGVLLVMAMIVAMCFVGRSAVQIWTRMLNARHNLASGKADQDEVRFILEPAMKKEIKTGFAWLFILIAILLLLAFFKIEL